jgi:hypothetical protein
MNSETEVMVPKVEVKPELMVPKVEVKPELIVMPTPSRVCVCPPLKCNCRNNGLGRIVYGIFHVIMALVAIYLSWKCNNGFNWLGFLGALFFPYIYIIYTLATKGTCGILEKS